MSRIEERATARMDDSNESVIRLLVGALLPPPAAESAAALLGAAGRRRNWAAAAAIGPVESRSRVVGISSPPTHDSRNASTGDDVGPSDGERDAPAAAGSRTPRGPASARAASRRGAADSIHDGATPATEPQRAFWDLRLSLPRNRRDIGRQRDPLYNAPAGGQSTTATTAPTTEAEARSRVRRFRTYLPMRRTGSEDVLPAMKKKKKKKKTKKKEAKASKQASGPEKKKKKKKK